MDKFVVLKLLSSEEIVCIMLDENEHEVKTMFPMLVKTFPRLSPTGRMAESITLAPYSYFANDDYFSFSKNQIVFMKELAPVHINAYQLAIDDFVNQIEAPKDPKEPELTVDEINQLSKQLGEMFKQQPEEVTDESVPLVSDLKSKQTLH